MIEFSVWYRLFPRYTAFEVPAGRKTTSDYYVLIFEVTNNDQNKSNKKIQ